jgi:hypothetical protein
MTFDEQDTIQRCPHDAENPYAQISRSLIRDETISPECRWLIIYMLSMKNGWKLSVKQIYAHVKKFIGMKRIYALLDEAIEARYIKREDRFEGNLKKGCTYFVSESPKFSKNVSDVADFGTPSAGMPKSAERKEEHSSSYEEDKKEHYKKKSAPPPPSADASDLCKTFFEKIRERSPKFKEPNLKKWTQEFELLLERDNRPKDEVLGLIEWAGSHSFWRANCLSPGTFRKAYDRMLLQMQTDTEQKSAEENRKYALLAKEEFPERLKNLTINARYAMNLPAGKEVPFSLPKKSFRMAFISMFGGSYHESD